MADTILDAINGNVINRHNISFARLRELGGKNRDVWEELGRGRAILSSHEQLDQYLYSYGPMIKSQWDTVLSKLSLSDVIYRLADYGCGQGLASALFFDRFGKDNACRVKEVILIEPSALALERARGIISCYSETTPLVTINKKFDDLTSNDVKGSFGTDSIHLFSNVLDIQGFEHFALFSKIFETKGRHIVLAVSHNRDFEGGTGRLRELANAVSDPKHSKWFTIKDSVIEEFLCAGDKPAVSWKLDLEVLHGTF